MIVKKYIIYAGITHIILKVLRFIVSLFHCFDV